MGKIAINTRFLIPNKLEGIGWYTYEMVNRLAKNHPEHTFYFLFDRDFDQQFIPSDNVIGVKLFPPARHPFLWYLWFEFSVHRWLKKNKVDVFFSPDGYLSLNNSTPSILTIHDLGFEHYPEQVPYLVRKYYRHFTPLYAKHASKIAVVSEATKRDVVEQYNINPDKIFVTYNGVKKEFKPLSEEKKTIIKEKYSEGYDYFLYVGAMHPRKNIPNLLKAFEVYKSKSKNDKKLLLTGRMAWATSDIETLYKSMTYKNDVIFTGFLNVDDLTQVTGAAFSMVYVSLFEGFGVPVAEAMHCGVPTITSNCSSLPEVAGDAGIIVEPTNPTEIANAMLELENNNALYNSLTIKSIENVKRFSWDESADILYKEILKLM